MSLFTKRERSLIFSWLKMTCFLKSILLLKFPVYWCLNILNLFNISMLLNKCIFLWFWFKVTTKACILYQHFFKSFFWSGGRGVLSICDVIFTGGPPFCDKVWQRGRGSKNFQFSMIYFMNGPLALIAIPRPKTFGLQTGVHGRTNKRV